MAECMYYNARICPHTSPYRGCRAHLVWRGLPQRSDLSFDEKAKSLAISRLLPACAAWASRKARSYGIILHHAVEWHEEG